MKKWETSLKRLPVKDEQGRTSLLNALRMLETDIATRQLLHGGTIPALFRLFQQLQADQTPFSFIIQKDQSSLLLDFFQDFHLNGLSFPEGGIAQQVFIQLCTSGLSFPMLDGVLTFSLLDYLSVSQLQRLESVHLANKEAVITYFATYEANTPKAKLDLGINLLLLAHPSFLEKKSPSRLAIFLRDMLPCFEARYAHCMDTDQLYSHQDRILSWFKLWQRHAYREEELEETDDYYQVDFATIIRYIPEYIWWNNGLVYRNGEKKYHFESPEFRHLAIGGSIRNGPDYRPYTRRMAKAFVTLPFDFVAGQRDMYIYFYGVSLGAGELLLALMQTYIRHRSSKANILTELSQWNPIIQKLADPVFENLDAGQAQSLLGYLYHCIRDQPGFNVKSRSITRLHHESLVYMERIQLRAQERQQRAAARRARVGANKLLNWKSHGEIQPLEIKRAESAYKIIELTDEKQLEREGSVMNHCVGTYVHKCMNDDSSIWSLREYRDSNWYSLVTIEIEQNQIVQARAAFNATPTAEYRKIIRVWASREKIEL